MRETTLTEATYEDRTCQLSYGVRVEVKWSQGKAYFVCRRAGFSITVLLLTDIHLYFFRDVNAMWIVPFFEGCFSVQATEDEAQQLAQALKRRLSVLDDLHHVGNPGLRDVFEKTYQAGHLWRRAWEVHPPKYMIRPAVSVEKCPLCPRPSR